ncbi:MAG: hypothetical protein Q4C54_03275 [Clostridia bacterium]|nr:hypothetical protein [Clostridia bacterium]
MKKIITPGRIFCLVMALACLIVGMTGRISGNGNDMLINKHKTGIGALNQETPASQRFTAAQDGLCAVEVMFSNYQKKIRSGTLTLTLEDETGKVVGSQTFNAADYKNNSFITMQLPAPVAGSAGKQFVLKATSDCTEQKGVTLRCGPSEGRDSAAVLVKPDGTQETENCLYLRTTYRTSKVNRMSVMTGILFALCFAVCIPMAGTKEGKRRA